MPITRRPKPPLKPFFFLPVLLLIIAVVLFSATDVEEINGIKVPGEPDPVLNAASVAGVDTNNNSVRDDVERLVARQFGRDPELYKLARLFAAKEQGVIVEAGPIAIKEYLMVIRCTDLTSQASDIVTHATLNNDERRSLYESRMAGAVFEGCP